MHQHRNPRLSRYGKKSKELLVDFINANNNRLLKPDQLQFGPPIELSADGLTKIKISFTPSNGFEPVNDILSYRRVELSNILGDEPLTVHVEEHTTPAILKAIYDQWGIVIEEEFIYLSMVVRDLSTAVDDAALPGFDSPDVPGRELYPVPPSNENRNYLLTFKPDHLVWYGNLKIQTRQSIRLLGNTIDSLMDLREFYRDGNFRKPHVDVYQPQGEFKLDDSRMDVKDRRHYESFLYVVKPDNVDATLPTYLTRLFTILTGDEWVVDTTKDVDFNVAGVRVLYNGLVSKEHPVTDHAFNYVIAFELGPQCSNLSGVLKIAYRYSDALTPANQPYNRAAPMPLFSR